MTGATKQTAMPGNAQAAHQPVLGILGAEAAPQEGAIEAKPLSKGQIIQRAIKYLRKCPPAIQGQNGSRTCFETALKIQDGFGLTEGEALVLMGQYYNPRCEPPWSEKELRHKIADSATKCTDRGHLLRGGIFMAERKKQPKAQKGAKDEKDGKEAKEKRFEKILEWVVGQVELFHDENCCYASTKGEVQKTYRLDTEYFEDWLVSKLYKDFPALLRIHEKADVIAILKAKAKHDSIAKPVFTRTARSGGAVFIDLCDPNWRQVRVTPTGWDVIEAAESPVRFQRFAGMRALPEPMRNGSINSLKRFLNVDGQHFILCAAWMAQALLGGRSFPVLVINGVQGTGKTTASRAIRSLIDPSEIQDSGAPRNEPDALLAASRSWVQSWDNLSSLSNEFSDLVCRIATGAGFRTRRLFSNGEENLVSVARPIMMNGIPDLLKRDDLADRSVPVKLLPLENGRKTDGEFWAEFERAKPHILGGLLDILSGALRELPNAAVAGRAKPRMLDFAHLGVALEKVCAWGDGAFLKAYEESRSETAYSVLEGSAVAQALIRFAEGREGAGAFSTSEIRKALADVAKAEGLNVCEKAFFNDRVFKSATERINPALLRCYGFALQWYRTRQRSEYRLRYVHGA
jgi:hypothetical protein